MRSAKREIGGFQFGFFYGEAFTSLDGILIPGDVNLDTFEFATALREAKRLWVSFEAMCSMHEFAVWHTRDIKKLSSEILEQSLIRAQIATEQSEWEWSSEDLSMARTARAAIEAELSRRHKQQGVAPTQARKPADRNSNGYVYLIQSPTGAFKIGRTKNPHDRMRTFGVRLPFEVEYLCLIETNDMKTLESELHQRFASKRVNGEWFNLALEDIEYIKGLAS